MDDWKHLLNWVSDVLSDQGKFIVLCPNYSFLYESHFQIPIVLNKRITYFLFRELIKRSEEKNDSVGLWDALNFVKKRDVEKFIKLNQKHMNLRLFDDVKIIDFMVDRVATDSEFRNRQKFIGGIAVLLKSIGVIRFVKLFRNILPYMKLEFQKF